MSTRAIHGYEIAARDKVENFHGNRLLYIHWEDHLSFCAAMAFPLPPDMPFGALIGEIMPAHYGMHPDWKSMDWTSVRWQLDGKPFTPDAAKSLTDNGIGHKSLLRFWTPGLTGYRNSFS